MKQFEELNFEEGEVLLFDKPPTWTSFDVVNKVRRAIKVKKVGHAGTLDPLATGLLILCTGKKTKQIDLIQATEKEYHLKMVLGKTTPTYDLESDFDSYTDTSQLIPEVVKSTILEFVGEQNQLPPMYSAVKVNGERLYNLARQGLQAELKPRKVEIKKIEVLNLNLPEVEILMTCSKGTYVRSFVHDIGRKLAVGGYLSFLRRTRIGEYSINDAYKLDKFLEQLFLHKNLTVKSNIQS